MREEPDEVLDNLLRDHFRRELDPHVGRAARAVSGRRAGGTGRPWVGFWIAGAIAAAVAIVWGAAARLAAPVAPKVSGQVAATTFAPTDADPMPIEQMVQSQAVDQGTVVVGNAGPARWVREKVLETTTFYDAQTEAQVELTVPKERVMLIGLETY